MFWIRGSKVKWPVKDPEVICQSKGQRPPHTIPTSDPKETSLSDASTLSPHKTNTAHVVADIFNDQAPPTPTYNYAFMPGSNADAHIAVTWGHMGIMWVLDE